MVRVDLSGLNEAIFSVPPKPPDIEIVNTFSQDSCFRNVNNRRPSLPGSFFRDRANSVKRKAEESTAAAARNPFACLDRQPLW